ncbi:MAG: hypothetical protein KIS67_21450 [Verrucomicrobiae bacterium]|nr:hypothetical protein [Verrucomicrobiae bacterium]
MSPNSQPQSANSNRRSSGPTIALDDVYFAIFRHKRLLLACVCLGIVGAAVVHAVQKPVYTSQAKLFVRYVLDRAEIDPENQDARIISAGSGGTILISEKEILASWDIAKKVAEAVTPGRILTNIGGGNNLLQAAGVIRSGIAVAPATTDMMIVKFQHPDRELVQPVLDELIKAYLRRHVEVRQGALFGEDYYSERFVEVKQKLAQTEEEIKRILSEARVVSLSEAKRVSNAQIEKFRSELHVARVELHSLRATLGEDSQSDENPGEELKTLIPADTLEHYATLLASLDALVKRERELLIQGYRESHPQVVATRESIAQLKAKKEELEMEHSGLVLNEPTVPGFDRAVERARVRALAAKVAGYEELLNTLQDEAFSLITLEPKLAELERQREQEAKNLAYISMSLDRARADEAGGNRVTGITVVDSPTPPTTDNTKTLKLMAAVFGAFVAMGLGAAALMEFVLDRTIKRPADVRRHLRLPFILAIPDTCWKRRHRALKLTPGNSCAAKSGKPADVNGAVANVIPPWDSNHHLRSYSEGLRERLLTHFEVNGITHKPKLVGVTSCGERAGVTTLASGVAAALSKTGDGNVLLVDLNGGQGATHSFYKGEPGCGLAEALEPEARAEAQVQENLYLVSLRPSGLSGTAADENDNRMLPSRISKFIPLLKASDYDYVVFDMPPVTPTSATPRLGGNMDMVLLVLESGKTVQQAAVHAGALLTEARVKTAVVLNKYRQHVPSLISQEM